MAEQKKKKNEPNNPIDYYKQQAGSNENELQRLTASRYGANYKNDPNYNQNMGLVQPNVTVNPNYSDNPYQHQIDMNSYLGAMQNQGHAQSALDQYKQLANATHTGKQEAEIQRQQAQLHMGNVMQNQGLGNQGIAESTQAKIMNQYANQVGNVDMNKMQQGQDILGDYQKAVQGVNTGVMEQNAELSTAMQQEQAEQNLNQFQTDISKYISIDGTTGSINSNKFNTLQEIDQFYAKYQGMQGISANELSSDYETVKEDFIMRNIKPNMNKPTRLREDEQSKFTNLLQQGLVKNGTVIKATWSRDGLNSTFVYYNGALYPVTNEKYQNNPDYVL